MTELVLVLGALGGLGGVSAAIKALVDWRKSRADAAGAITGAAKQYVEIVQTDLQNLRSRVSAQDEENAELKTRLNKVESKLDALTRCAMRAYAELRSNGSSIEAPPVVDVKGVHTGGR